MTSKNSVDTIIYEILKEIPDRDTICALDFGLISLAVQQAIEDGGIPKPDHKLTGDSFRKIRLNSRRCQKMGICKKHLGRQTIPRSGMEGLRRKGYERRSLGGH